MIEIDEQIEQIFDQIYMLEEQKIEFDVEKQHTNAVKELFQLHEKDKLFKRLGELVWEKERKK